MPGQEGCSHGFVGFCDACHEQRRLIERDKIIEGQELRLQEVSAALLKSAKNLCWTAQTVHQGHHEARTWRECSKGVCGSMGHMLAQIGFDKELNLIAPVP